MDFSALADVGLSGLGGGGVPGLSSSSSANANSSVLPANIKFGSYTASPISGSGNSATGGGGGLMGGASVSGFPVWGLLVVAAVGIALIKKG